jgi:hypothetical protein
LDDRHISWVTDATPYKIGKYTPGGIPIIGDMNYADAYLLLVRNYMSSVLHRERDYMGKGGKFIVPIPSPVII